MHSHDSLPDQVPFKGWEGGIFSPKNQILGQTLAIIYYCNALMIFLKNHFMTSSLKLSVVKVWHHDILALYSVTSLFLAYFLMIFLKNHFMTSSLKLSVVKVRHHDILALYSVTSLFLAYFLTIFLKNHFMTSSLKLSVVKVWHHDILAFYTVWHHYMYIVMQRHTYMT
jgi:hypothetical protein